MYRAEKTDRMASKAKKIGVIVLLKAGSGTKTTGDGKDYSTINKCTTDSINVASRLAYLHRRKGPVIVKVVVT
jgi:hypothetical protein